MKTREEVEEQDQNLIRSMGIAGSKQRRSIESLIAALGNVLYSMVQSNKQQRQS